MTRAKFNQNGFGKALKNIRLARELSQEAFSLASSRTYVSSLERELKTPTLNKVDDLAEVLEVHPLTLLTMAYMKDPATDSVDALFSRVSKDLSDVRKK